ncbi:response regulator [Hymenobacter busanensis]|uniref:Response regulator n=1 Tax=Hymenobacter busanensis TaxID=2607656 RepID=A0A7L4ZVL5_9BACT|nr:response regulator [Hymenobacter busanensis]KAA9339364.1 response regulator [Hymenobacter busanensis]QHJ06875.1 response regulator [Hymenobacter busanensis]
MKTFLIDDDNLGNYLTEQLLRIEGFSNTIQTFESAQEALETLQQCATETPAVIFLDLNMPIMNGWQFLDALVPYESRLRGRCRIFVLTSSLALADMEKAKTYDLVAGLIHKPIDSEEIQAIRSQLEDEDIV